MASYGCIIAQLPLLSIFYHINFTIAVALSSCYQDINFTDTTSQSTSQIGRISESILLYFLGSKFFTLHDVSIFTTDQKTHFDISITLVFYGYAEGNNTIIIWPPKSLNDTTDIHFG